MENWQTASQQVDLEGNGFYSQLKSSYDQIIFYYDEFIETLQTFEHLIFFKFGGGVFDIVMDLLFLSHSSVSSSPLSPPPQIFCFLFL